MVETVTRAVFEAEDRGVAATAAALNQLTGAATGSAKAVDNFTKTTQTAAPDIAGVERRVDALQKRLAGAPAAWSRYEAAMRAANQGQAAGILSGEKYADTVRQITSELQKVVAPRLDMDAANTGLTALLGNTEKVTASTRAAAREMLQMAQAQQTADAEAARGRELLAKETARYTAEVDDLRAKLDPAYASGRRMREEIELIAQAERMGIEVHGGYDAALQRVVDRYDDTAIAARRAADAQREMIQQARRDQDNSNATFFASGAQQRFNQTLGVRTPSTGSARASAAAFEEEARAVTALRAAIDPLAAAQARLNAEVAEYQAMRARGSINDVELAKATEMANAGYQIQAVRLGAVGEAAKLTSNQLLNLSRQGNDILTMAAMGMPLSMIVTSQIGQIYGALEENQKGVRGSIEAITNSVKNFASGLGPVGIALGALGVAAATFALVTRRDVEPIEDVIKGQAGAVRELRDAYGLAGDAAESYARRAPNAVRRRAEGTTDDSLVRAEQEIRDRMVDQYAGSFNRLNEMRFEGAAELRAAFDDLFQSVEDGVPRFIEFQEQLALIPDADVPYFIRDAIKANDEWAETFVPLQQNIEGTQSALNGIALAAQNYKKAMSDLVALTPDLRTNAERINDAFNAARSGPAAGDEMVALFQRQKAMAADTATALDVYTQARADLAAVGLGEDARAIAEINAQYDALEDQYLGNADALSALVDARKAAIDAVGAESALAEKARRDNYELDLRAVNARTAAEKASIESERVRIDLIAQGYGETEAATRAQEAYNLAIAQSSAEWTKAAESRQFARDDALANAQAEIDSFGMTAGAAQAYGQAIQQLTAYRRAAAEARMPIDPAEEQAIRDAAAAAGAYTDALARMNMERDQTAQLELLRGEAQLVGLSENARAVAMAGLEAEAELRSQNIATTDAWGQAYVRNAQNAAAMRVEIDKQTEAVEKQRQLVENVASTFLDIFTDNSSDGFFDRIMKGLADISRQFAELGKQRLLDMFSGGALGYTAGLPAPGQRTVAPVGVTGGGVAMNYQGATLPRVESAVLPSLTRTTSRLAANSNDLASNIELSAKTLGVAARDIATVISFETGGTFDPWQKGPTTKWGQHRGLIQWGEPQRAQYGVTQMSTIAEQMEAVTKYLYNAGVRPGHGLLDVYSAVNAGRVGRYNASDTAAGGTWGTVRDKVNHQMSSHAAKADQLLGDRGAMRSAVAGGVVDAQRALTTGQPVPISSGASGADPWSGMRTATPGANQAGGSLFGQGGRIQGFMQSPLGMGGMNALSAFGAGMSSGSPMSGGFSGALGAFGMGLGPIGIIGGAAAGLLGGLFGRSRQRRQERRQRQEQERQQQLQAQQQLEQQLPAILELQDTLLDRASGTLTQQRARIDSQIKQYQQLAATAKNSAEQERLNAMAASLDDYMQRQYDELRLTAGSVVQSMMAGRGLEPEFAKAVSAVREQSLTIRNYLADLTAATGAGSAEVQAATAAGREQLLRTLSGADEVTEIWTRLDGLTGTAAQLSAELQKLGMNAEEAGRAVSDHLNRGIQKMRDDFVRGIADETADASGLGYLTQIRSLVERRDTMRADATSIGADPALIDRWFGVQARNILDQAGLLDKEIEPLVRAFPDLANVLGDSSAKIERSLADAENDLRTSYQRVKQFADQLASFRADINLDRNLSPLGPEERLLEAQRQFRAVSEKAAAGDAKAQDQLINLSRSYLDEAKSFHASSEAYYAIFNEVDATLKATEAKALQEINLAAAQHSALLTLNESVLTIPQALANLNAAQAARDTAQGQSLQAYVQAMNPQVAVPSYQAPQAVAPIAPAAPAPAPAGPAYEYHNGMAGNWRMVSFAGRQFHSFVRAGETDAQAGQREWEASLAQQSQSNADRYANQKRFGGEIGFGFNGLGYQNGGIIANGIWDQDSVIARHREGGQVWLAGGEGILTAPAMQRPGVRSFMEAANANRLPEMRLSQMRLPQIAMPAPVRLAGGSDHRGIIQALQSLERRVEDVAGRQTQAIVASDDVTRETIRSSSEASRRREASAGRIADKKAELKAARAA